MARDSMFVVLVALLVVWESLFVVLLGGGVGKGSVSVILVVLKL